MKGLPTGRIYTTSDLSSISGASMRDVNARRQRGIFPYGEARGGSVNLFHTLLEVVLFCAQQTLIQRGIPSKEAIPLAEQLTLAAFEALEDRQSDDDAMSERMSWQALLLIANPDREVRQFAQPTIADFIAIYQPPMSREYRFARIMSSERLIRFLSGNVVHTALTINPLGWLIDVFDQVERRMEDQPDAEAPPLDGHVGKVAGQ